jgi:hypothetical protein
MIECILVYFSVFELTLELKRAYDLCKVVNESRIVLGLQNRGNA